MHYFERLVDESLASASHADFLLQGARWLEALSHDRAGQSFLELTEDAREKLLRQVEKSDAGRQWLDLLLRYLLEALLSDPVYGGNNGSKGWRWLAHRPGFPRPLRTRTFPYLIARRHVP